MNDRSDMSRVNAQRMPARHITGLLFALLTAGCAGLERVPAGEADRKDATQSAVVAPDPVAAPVASTGEIPQIPTPAVAAAGRLLPLRFDGRRLRGQRLAEQEEADPKRESCCDGRRR